MEKVEFYKKMLKIRLYEKKIQEKFQEQEMRCPMHLCIGQEAVAVGVCQCLEREDFIYSTHRGHGQYIAKGGDTRALISELYCRDNGCSHGRGGSMHINDIAMGVGLSSAIVGGNVPIATGHALGFQLQGKNQVVCVFLGDGATEEGVVYESICYAVLRKLPIVYICENNQYAMYTELSEREPISSIYMKFSNIIDAMCIDGNDVEGVYQNVYAAVRRARVGEGPTFIEMQTYRFVNHYETKNGSDIGPRSIEEYEMWKKRDPVRQYEIKLLEEHILDEKSVDTIRTMIEKEIEIDFVEAYESRNPVEERLYEGVWGKQICC